MGVPELASVLDTDLIVGSVSEADEAIGALLRISLTDLLHHLTIVSDTWLHPGDTSWHINTLGLSSDTDLSFNTAGSSEEQTPSPDIWNFATQPTALHSVVRHSLPKMCESQHIAAVIPLPPCVSLPETDIGCCALVELCSEEHCPPNAASALRGADLITPGVAQGVSSPILVCRNT